jgi:hypothetical protein
MASYQIPQFLDSGDKILGPLNLRQFAYALAGFLISALIFTTISSVDPRIGIYALIPCLPVIILFGYLALGKYNGRDAEIYVLKFILFMSKPRQMAYIKVPYTTDLDTQLASLSSDKILKEWNSRVSKIKELEGNQLKTFDNLDSLGRAQKIRDLGIQLDMGFYNTITSVKQQEIKLQTNKDLLQRNINPDFKPKSINEAIQNNTLLEEEINFFD